MVNWCLVCGSVHVILVKGIGISTYHYAHSRVFVGSKRRGEAMRLLSCGLTFSPFG